MQEARAILLGMATELFGSARKAEYPWQLIMSPWAPAAKMTESERRTDRARHMFEWEMLGREEKPRRNVWDA